MLFGHQNDDTNKPADPDMGTPGVNPLAVDSETGASLPVAQPDPVTPDPVKEETKEEPSVLNQPTETETEADTSTAPVVEPTETSLDTPKEEPVVAPTTKPSTPASSNAADDGLLGLKQQALTQLSPLLNHLDQTPEERFRTTMMLIQSTDNQALLKDAYEAANSISDDKVRAQALLDVVNEINYFTQPKAN